MARRSASEIYGGLRAAGLSAARAVILTAIALAESGGDDTARGDLNLQNDTWGPSFGLFQVRTLKSETGTGSDRDINWLAASDANQAKAAYDISHGGVDFSPWSVYTSGRYTQFLGQAQAAAGSATITPTADGPVPMLGPSWLPWNWPGAAVNAATAGALGGVRTIVLEGLVVILGAGLVGFGLTRAFAPQLKSAAHAAAKIGEVAVL